MIKVDWREAVKFALQQWQIKATAEDISRIVADAHLDAQTDDNMKIDALEAALVRAYPDIHERRYG